MVNQPTISSAGDPVLGAQVFVSGIDWNVTTTLDGEFWRLLVPGEYHICADSTLGSSGFVDVIVEADATSIVNLTLK